MIQLIKKDGIKIGVSFALIWIVFQIAFYRESPLNLLGMILAIYWLFVIPGYSAMIFFSDTFSVEIRLILGSAIGVAFFGVMSYYLGLMGLPLPYHWMILPPLAILVSLSLYIVLHKNKGGLKTAN